MRNSEIENKLNSFKRQLRLSTVISASCVVSAMSLWVPILSDKSFTPRVHFCVLGTPCSGEQVYLSTEATYQAERENGLFADNTTIKDIVPAQDDRAIIYAIFSSALLFGAYGISMSATRRLKKAIHLEYTAFKVQALQNNILAKAEVDLANISKTGHVDVTKFALEIQNSDAINSLKTDAQIDYESLQGHRAGEIEQQLHKLKLIELEKEELKLKLEIKELAEKICPLPLDRHKAEGDTPNKPEPELKLEPQHLWYNRVLNEPCKVVTGVSGSGKSTFEHALVQLARQDGQYVVVLYPLTVREARDENSVVLSEPEAITDFLAGFFQSVADRKKECKSLGLDEDEYLPYLEKNKTGKDGRVAMFAMEINNWEASGVYAQLIADFYRLCFTDIRKWGYTLTMTGQSINQGSVASKLENFSDLLKQQTKIKCLATTCPETGRSISKGVALVSYSDMQEKKDAQELPLVFYKPRDKSVY